MTIGPAPMIMIDWISVLFGISDPRDDLRMNRGGPALGTAQIAAGYSQGLRLCNPRQVSYHKTCDLAEEAVLCNGVERS